MNKLYVGNLPFRAHSDELSALFAPFGEVVQVTIVHDRATGRSKGFGFVEFADSSAANEALKINGQEFQGRNLKVSFAENKPRENRGHSGSGHRPRRDREHFHHEEN